MERRERRTSSKQAAVSLTVCPRCLATYERVLGRVCPFCAHESLVAGRSTPEQVDGVLSELDPAALARLQRDIAGVDDEPLIPYGATAEIAGACRKRGREKKEAQQRLRSALALWGGWHGGAVSMAQRAFWLEYGIDVGTAQTLSRSEADNLRERITAQLRQSGVKIAIDGIVNTA